MTGQIERDGSPTNVRLIAILRYTGEQHSAFHRTPLLPGTYGTVPVEVWLADLRRQNTIAFKKCIARVARLRMLGHELRRPEADVLRDGIYELRVRDGRVHYRILYFFHGRNIAVLGHAITKIDAVPPIEIERALQRKRAVEAHPKKHIADEEPDYGTP